MIELSETLLTGNDCVKILNVLNKTHALFRKTAFKKIKRKEEVWRYLFQRN